MRVRVDQNADLKGIDALTKCSDGIEDGAVVRVVLPGAPKAKIFIRVYDDRSYDEIVDVPEAVWRRMRAAAKAEPDEVTLRPLTRLETWSRRLTAKNAAAVLAMISAVFAAVIALAPLMAKANNKDLTIAQAGLVATVGWQPGRELSQSDVEGLRHARESATRVAPAPDQMPALVKVLGGGFLLLSAAVTMAVALKAANQD